MTLRQIWNVVWNGVDSDGKLINLKDVGKRWMSLVLWWIVFTGFLMVTFSIFPEIPKRVVRIGAIAAVTMLIFAYALGYWIVFQATIRGIKKIINRLSNKDARS